MSVSTHKRITSYILATAIMLAFTLLIVAQFDNSSPHQGAQLHATKGWDRLRQGDLVKATDSFNIAIHLDPSNIDATWGLAVLAAKDKNYDRSLSLFSFIRRKADQTDGYRLYCDILRIQLISATMSQNLEELAQRLQLSRLTMSEALELVEPPSCLTELVDVQHCLDHQETGIKQEQSQLKGLLTKCISVSE